MRATLHPQLSLSCDSSSPRRTLRLERLLLTIAKVYFGVRRLVTDVRLRTRSLYLFPHSQL